MFWNRRETDLGPIEQRLAALETAVKLLQVEWNEVYDKITAAQARDRKRDRDAQRASALAPPVAPDPASRKAALWRQAAEVLKGGRNVR